MYKQIQDIKLLCQKNNHLIEKITITVATLKNSNMEKTLVNQLVISHYHFSLVSLLHLLVWCKLII